MLNLFKRGHSELGMFFGLERIRTDQIPDGIQIHRDTEFHACLYTADNGTELAESQGKLLKEQSEFCWRCERAEVNAIRIELEMGKH
jgi:hypothetical protein